MAVAVAWDAASGGARVVAEASADVYPRFGPTMEWDTCAAHAVVSAAGKQVLDMVTREPLSYNKPDLLNPFFIVE